MWYFLPVLVVWVSSADGSSEPLRFSFRMSKKSSLFALLLLTLLVMNCSGPNRALWVSETWTDEFTDEKSCLVTVGSYYTRSGVFTRSMHLYPFVGTKNDSLRLGVRSGGTVRIPVGDVQIRIDDNKAWTITTTETPLDYVPETPYSSYGISDSVNQARIDEYTRAAMDNVSKAMSPFTATTGEKAQLILNEMIHGQRILYRTIGLNAAASTTGETEIDSSFLEALRACNIPITSN